jgi:hypothetical protein
MRERQSPKVLILDNTFYPLKNCTSCPRAGGRHLRLLLGAGDARHSHPVWRAYHFEQPGPAGKKRREVSATSTPTAPESQHKSLIYVTHYFSEAPECIAQQKNLTVEHRCL